jgi:serine protease AprX
MSNENKISPAFEPFLAGLDEDDKRDAIVIYEAPESEEIPSRGRLREVKGRLDQVRRQVNIQKAVQEEIFDHYQEASRDLGYDDDEPLEISTIGSGMLPMATVEVTSKTLEALAEQPNVVAVLPNQNIHLIQPRRVEYSELVKQECQAGG